MPACISQIALSIYIGAPSDIPLAYANTQNLDEVANLGYSRDRYRHIGYANIKPRSWHIDLTTLERTASLNLLRQAARIHPDEGFSTVRS